MRKLFVLLCAAILVFTGINVSSATSYDLYALQWDYCVSPAKTAFVNESFNYGKAMLDYTHAVQRQYSTNFGAYRNVRFYKNGILIVTSSVTYCIMR